MPARSAIVPGSIAALLVAIAMSVTQPVAQQAPAGAQSPPIFRADVNAVQLDVRAVDRDGRFVRDLSREDFQVYEDDAEQTLSTFALVDLPIVPGDTRSIPTDPPDIASNRDAGEGRLYVLVLDDTTPPSDDPTMRIGAAMRATRLRAIARNFVDRSLGPYDRASVAAISGRAALAQEFTSDRTRLTNVIDRYQANFGQTFPSSCSHLRSVGASLRGVAGWLGQITGRRKAIVLIAERLGAPGRFADIGNLPDLDATLECEGNELRDLVNALARANVTLYILDPVGVPGGRTGTPGRGRANVVPAVPNLVDDDSASDAGRKQGLVALAEATGGFAFLNSNDYESAYNRIVEENSSYYVLGYPAPQPARDRRFHRIRVAVRRPGVRVQARSGYYDREPLRPRMVLPNVPRVLSDALQSPIPVSGFALRAAAVAVREPTGRTSLAVVVEREPGRADVVVTLVKAGNDRAAVRQEHGDIPRLVTRFAVEPGHYHIRVAALADDGRSGSVLHEVDVPDFSKGRLAMTDIALAFGADRSSSRSAGAVVPLWDRALTTMRGYPVSATIRAVAEVYDHANGSPHTVEFTTTLQAADGRLIHRETGSLPRDRTSARTLTFPVDLRVPLADAAPGVHTLRVEARAGSETVSREVSFSVR